MLHSNMKYRVRSNDVHAISVQIICDPATDDTFERILDLRKIYTKIGHIQRYTELTLIAFYKRNGFSFAARI